MQDSAFEKCRARNGSLPWPTPILPLGPSACSFYGRESLSFAPLPPSLTISLAQLSSKDGAKELGEPPATLPTYMIDAARPTQISSSCVQLLSLLSAEKLASVPVLIIFNKIDLPCYMSLVEMKSLFRIQDIITFAKQPIAVLETSARDGTGLSNVLQWFNSTLCN
nr:ADP-ribosylation factor-like protein 16 isoform X3 [Anolis sagrei ordinatus]